MFARRVLTLARVLASLGVLAVAVAAQAGEERYKWWQSEQVKSEVGLSADQSQQLEEIFQGMLARMRSDKEELDRQEQTLSQLMRDATVDEAGIVAAIDRVEAARAKASKTRILMLYRMYRVLSPEQRQKLDAMHDRLRQGRGGRGSR